MRCSSCTSKDLSTDNNLDLPEGRTLPLTCMAGSSRLTKLQHNMVAEQATTADKLALEEDAVHT